MYFDMICCLPLSLENVQMNVSSSCTLLIRHDHFSGQWYQRARAGAIFQLNFHISSSIQISFQMNLAILQKISQTHQQIYCRGSEQLNEFVWRFHWHHDFGLGGGCLPSPTSHYRVTAFSPKSSFKQSTSSSCCPVQSQIAMLCVAPGNPRLRTSVLTGGCVVNHPLEQRS